MQVQKNLPRKKRRKLEAAREMLEDNEGEEEEEDEEGDEKRGRSRGKDKKKQETDKKGLTLKDLGYMRAKAVKAKQRAIDSGKMERPKPDKKQSRSKPRNQPRGEEMKDLFKSDMGEKKQGRGGAAAAAKPRTKSKNSFKSKARYKRR
jgi:ATP-dependent RNA helicase DDX27